MIREATNDDFSWMAQKSLSKYNQIYLEQEGREYSYQDLETFFKKESIMSVVFDDKTAYFSFEILDNTIRWHAWYSEKPGNGIALYKFVSSLAKKLGYVETGFIHKCEHKMKKFLKKNKVRIVPINDNLEFAYRLQKGEV